MRRGVPGGRIREVAVLVLDPSRADEAEMWRRLFNIEPGWLPEALVGAGLPEVDHLYGRG
jgi:hypothetical protein